MGNHKDICCSHNIPLVHMHKRCMVIFMFLKDLKENKIQTRHLHFFQRDLEMPLSEKCIFLGEAQDGTNYESVKGVKDSPTFLVDEYFPSFKLVHDSPSSTPFTTTTTHENDNWVRGFFLLVPSKQHLAPTLIHVDFLRAPPIY